ncbi:BUD13-like [Melia azedarach]|uniref:BUD13-like n=1 Tax=Melia azedarach TaxID=155640 RepID=A0ACC1WWA1_MELAZ|nr:BUD13-like [Melia azedarach]
MRVTVMKKRRRRKPDTNLATGILVVDEDCVWQKPDNLGEEEEGNDSPDEEKPQVDEDIEDSKKTNSDMSPLCKLRTRNDSPSAEPEPRPTGSGRENTDLSLSRKQQSCHDILLPYADQNLDIPLKRKHHQAQSPKPDISISSQGQWGFSNRDDDLSPPWKNKKDPGTGRPGLTDLSQSSHVSEVAYLSLLRKIQKEEKGVHRTGLISGSNIWEGISKKKEEDLLRDDSELDKIMKDRLRWGDPMAHLVKKKHVYQFFIAFDVWQIDGNNVQKEKKKNYCSQ